MMSWSKPEVIEINMSAEIGAYQDDDRDEPPIVFQDQGQVSARELPQ